MFGIFRLTTCLGVIIGVWYFILRSLRKCFASFDCRAMCCIGYLLRKHGYDAFDAFTMRVIVHECRGGMRGFVKIKAGDAKAKTPVSKKGKWEESLTIRVAQGQSTLKVEFYEDRATRSDLLLGSTTLRIKEDIMDERFPKRRWLSLKLKGHQKAQVLVSFVDAGESSEATPLLEGVSLEPGSMLSHRIQEEVERHRDALLSARTDGSADTARSLAGGDKLSVLAKVCSGPLQKTGFLGSSTEYYFKMEQIPGGKWLWSWWKDKKACDRSEEPKGSIPVLAITGIVPDERRSQFVIRYRMKKNDPREIILKRVDRERDAWVESIRLFIRQYREERARQQDPEAQLGASDLSDAVSVQSAPTRPGMLSV
mmetsp:Transcript_10705/g.25489  ORF Transcript_10705/g.25489 Transcript_10705/m.25489 type:complete len:368 (+) Transcript_10705:58-1161(+)